KLWTLVVGTSSTKALVCALGRRLRRPGDRDFVLPRSRFICHACSDLPSIPRSRAHCPVLSPARFAAARHRLASLASLIFLPAATRHLRVASSLPTTPSRSHPGVADGSRRSGGCAPDDKGLGPQNLGVRLRRIHSGGAGAAPPMRKACCLRNHRDDAVIVLGVGPENLGVRLRRIHSGGAGAAPPKTKASCESNS